MLASKPGETAGAIIAGTAMYASLCAVLSVAWFLLAFVLDGPLGGTTAALMALVAGTLFGFVRVVQTKRAKNIAIYLFGGGAVIGLVASAYWLWAAQL